MDQKYKTRYLGGMDKDTAPTRYGDTTYFHAENLRLTVNTDGTATILTNIEGDSAELSNNTMPGTNGTVIIGSVFVDTYVVVFVTSNNNPTSGNTDRIYKFQIIPGVTAVVATLVCSGIFQFSKKYPIQAVSNYDGTHYKIYWADGYNMIRGFDIINDTITTSSDFDLLPSTSFAAPTITDITSGHLMTGMYQYSYQLYKLYHGETMYAPVSSLMHITQSSDFLNETQYSGSNVGVITGKGINGQFTNPVAGFNRVRIVALQYESLNQNPLIRIVIDKPIIGTANEVISFYDSGDSIGTLAVEEFQLINGSYITPQTIAIKNNMLFAGNVQSTPFQPTFDSKAYRYNAAGYAYIWNTTGTICYKSALNSVSSFVYHTLGIGGTPWDYNLTNWVTGITVSSIPDDFDSFNLYNDIDKDYSDADANRNKYIPGGWTPGSSPDIIAASGGTNSNHYAGAGTLRQTSTFDPLAITGTGVAANQYTIATTGQYQIQLSGVTANLAFTGAAITNWAATVTIIIQSYIKYNGNIIASQYQRNVAPYFNTSTPYTIPTLSSSQQTMTAGDLITAGVIIDVQINAPFLQTDILTSLTYTDPIITNLVSGGLSTQGTTLGGEGANIRYTFSANSTVTNFYKSGTPAISTGLGIFSSNPSFLTYASPYTDLNKMYQWDEIYRFGIEFIDAKGRPSPVYWIGDIRFPSHAMVAQTWGAIHQNNGSVQTTLLPNINFKVKNVPATALGWRIMRVKRNQLDRTVVMEGVLIPTAVTGSTLGNYFDHVPYTRPVGRGAVPPVGTYSTDLFNFISPEVNYNKNITWDANDRVSIHAKYRISSASYPDISHLGSMTYVGADLMHYGNFDHTENFTTSTYPFEFPIISGLMVIPPTWTDGMDTVLGGYNYRNFCYLDPTSSTSLQGPCGTNFLVKLSSVLDPTSANYPIGASEYSLYHAVYKRPNLGAYGGYAYAARLNNTYQPCSDYINSTNATYYTNTNTYVTFFLPVHGGDVTSGIFNKLWCTYLGDVTAGQRQGTILSFPSITPINLYLSNGSTPDRLATTNQPLFWAMQETQGAHDAGGGLTFFQSSDMYIYNSVFSQESTTQTNISVTNIIPLTNFYNRTYYSDIKVSGELIDSFTIFRPGNYKEVNGLYGDITSLLNFKNTLIFFQERAVGFYSVQERSTITDNNLAPLIIGTGGILDRYDYFTTESGTGVFTAITKSDKIIYWYDGRLQEILALVGTEVKHLSKEEKIQSYLNFTHDGPLYVNFPIIPTYLVATDFDQKYREVLFYFSTFGTASSRTLVFNEEVGKFTGFYSISPQNYFIKDKFGNSYYTQTANGYINLYRRSYSGYNILAGVPVESKLSVVINPYGTVACRFDMLELPTILKSSGTEVQSTWTSIVASNSYQNSGLLTLTPGSNIIRRYRTWRFNSFRDASADNPRMKDNYLKMDFTLNSTDASNGSFLVEDMLTSFFMLSPK